MNAPARKALAQGLASALLIFGLAGWLPAQYGKAIDFSKLVVVGDSLAAGVENGSLEDSQPVHGLANVIAQKVGSPPVAIAGHSFWPMCSLCAALV
jgi:hypothetical protein